MDKALLVINAGSSRIKFVVFIVHCLSAIQTLRKFKPVLIIFFIHGYSCLVHHNNDKNLHVRRYKEEGTITAPFESFDIAVRNDIDRFHLVVDVIERVAKLASIAANAKQFVRGKLIEHKRYINRYGQDMPESRDCKWGTE